MGTHAQSVVSTLATKSLYLLIAEDNPVNREFATALLEDMGHRVQGVQNGREAVDAVKTGAFDAILMDVHMPEMDGIQAMKHIRDMPPPAGGLPIIAMTAESVAGTKEQLLAAGMDDYIAKPIDIRELAAMLGRIAQNANAAPSKARRSLYR
jgi:CheY-like chemotaxis protein